MNRILLFFIALAACTLQASAQTKYKEIVPDTAKVRYINVSSTNSKQSKLCINGPLYIDAWLLWKQTIGCNGT